MQKLSVAVIPALVIVLALTGCGPQPTPQTTEPADSTPSPTPTATEAPADRVFTLPADCTGLLPESRQTAFEDQGLILLGGPGGKYPNYYADPTPEEQAGGISCIWGDEAVPESTVTVSAAPLTPETRSNVVDTLLAQGLNEAVLDDGISYAQLGDENSAPAILNIIRDDSWVSVIEALGGEAFFDEAVELAGEATAQVYGS